MASGSYVPCSLVMVRVHTEAQAGILLAEASSAICVQRFDGSRTVQKKDYHKCYEVWIPSITLNSLLNRYEHLV